MSDRSMERLVGLAQKTGGKLIVHNPLEDHDVVILDVDEYEKLVLGENDYEMFRPDVREMSEGELLDQINRDIATWRANKDQEEKWEREMMLDELDEDVEGEEPLFSPSFGHDSHPADWHSISDVINKKYTPKLETVEEEIKIENVPFRPMGVDIAWQEEPLASDEPVFYEEPV